MAADNATIAAFSLATAAFDRARFTGRVFSSESLARFVRALRTMQPRTNDWMRVAIHFFFRNI